mmetsp:Transcript_66228/g.92129  ORF Transcript_66228/g.92129 Transcript_66228/m.92129 type:complete len:124 (+) Transcript_66228:219-590(+)
MAEDPHQRDGKNKKGWSLCAHNFYDNDKRDDSSIFTMIHEDPNIKNNKWKLTLDETDGRAFFIQAYQVDTEVTKGLDTNNWAICSHRFYDSDKRDDNSTYTHLREDLTEGKRWRLLRDCNPLR